MGRVIEVKPADSNAPFPIVVTEDGTTYEPRFVNWKALLPIAVTAPWIVTEDRALLPINNMSGMTVTPDPIVADVSCEYEKAFPSEVTELGITTVVNCVEVKARSPIVTTPSGIVTLVNAELPNASLGMEVMPLPIVADVNCLANTKARDPIEVTESGITTDVKAVCSNALEPIVVTDEGIVTLVNDEPANASSGIAVMDEGMTTEVTAELRKAPGDIEVASVLSVTAPVQPVFPVMTPASIV